MLTLLKRLATAALLLSTLYLNVQAGEVSGANGSGSASSLAATGVPTGSAGGSASQCTCPTSGSPGTTAGSTGGSNTTGGSNSTTGGNNTTTGANNTTTGANSAGGNSTNSTTGGSSSGPQFTIYSDKTVSANVLPPLNEVKGFTVLYVVLSSCSLRMTRAPL